MLWDLHKVAHVIAHTDEYKPNCGVVVMDFLVRITTALDLKSRQGTSVNFAFTGRAAPDTTCLLHTHTATPAAGAAWVHHARHAGLYAAGGGIPGGRSCLTRRGPGGGDGRSRRPQWSRRPRWARHGPQRRQRWRQGA